VQIDQETTGRVYEKCFTNRVAVVEECWIAYRFVSTLKEISEAIVVSFGDNRSEKQRFGL
jgi:hypothetical protein